TRIAVLAEDQRLNTDLRTVGEPGGRPGFLLARSALLVVDGNHTAVPHLDDVHLCDQAMTVARELNASCLAALFISEHLRRRERFAVGIDTFVPHGAFDRVGVVHEDTLHPLVVEEAGTVDELVDHPRRQVVGRSRAGRRAWRRRGNGTRRHRTHPAIRQGASMGEYARPSETMTRSPRPSAGPRSTKST